MRITSLEAIPYTVPVERIARFAAGARDRADHVLIRIHTDGGLVGEAEAQPRPYTYGDTQASIVAAVDDHLAPAVAGLDPLATQLIEEKCARLKGHQVARAAVDLAAWDLAGKILERTCRELLGGYAPDVAAAHMVSYDEPAAMAAEALEYWELLGIRTFKVKVGRDVATDIAAVTAIRDQLPDADLYVDANRGWDVAQAFRAGEALVGLGVWSIEEPLPLDERKARLQLADHWTVPLVGDESCISFDHVVQEVEYGAVRAVSIKTARTGFTESRRILDHCLATGTQIIVGSQYEGAVGVLATAAFAPAFSATAGRAAEVMNYTDLGDDILATPIDIRDGRIFSPALPGLGIVIDEDKLNHYRVDDRRSAAATA